MTKLFKFEKTAAFLLTVALAAGAVMPRAFFSSNSVMMAYAAEEEEISSAAETTADTDEPADNPDGEEADDKIKFDFAAFFSNEDVKRVTERALKYYSEEFYRAKSGETPANVDIKLPVDDETVVITLTDENDNVLDVYYINCWQYTGVNQNGEYADLIAMDEECYRNEDGYIAPLYNLYDAVIKHYTENYNSVPVGTGFFNNTENRLFNGNGFEDFYLMDDKYQTIIKYIIDPETGKGTDSNGNDVDLVPYIYPGCRDICSFVRKHFQERNGEQLLVTYYHLDEEKMTASVEVMTTDDKILDVYTVDLNTLMAETKDGGSVNLYVYTLLPIMKNPDFREVNEKIIEHLADAYYTERTGEKATQIAVELPYDSFKADVSLMDDKGNVLEEYTVDVWSYRGKDSKGGSVELKTDEFYINEDELFASYSYFFEAANACYNETYGGTELYQNSFSSNEIDLILNGTDNVNVYIIDNDYQTLEKYTIERATGIAFDSKGNRYDLNKYVLPESRKFCEYVRKDYRSKNDEQRILTTFRYNEDRTRISIYVLDNNDNVLDLYEIDPVTWLAETSGGNTVDLKVYDEITGDKAKDYFAPLSQMAEMAEVDYKSKYEKAPAGSELKNNLDGSFSVVLSDDNGEVLATYTFDPQTGKGKDSNGRDIDLPQTGINTAGRTAAVAAAAALMSIGSAAVYISGRGRRKKEENAK